MDETKIFVNPKTQIFTPESIIETMLNYVPTKDIVGKRFLENSFGDGRILAKIVEKYIEAGLEMALGPNEIAKKLSSNIIGIEADRDLFLQGRTLLDSVAKQYGIHEVSWDLRNQNALNLDSRELFDYVIGNPPYLEYKEIEKNEREIIKKEYESCSKGKFDYCYAFIEFGQRHLTSNGKMIQLIPGSVFKNKFANTLREKLKSGVEAIIDYSGVKVFGDALVSPCIFVFNASSKQTLIDVVRVATNEQFRISKANLGDKWLFSRRRGNEGGRRFGDKYHASMPVATLLNEAFLVSRKDVEPKVAKKAASPKSLAKGDDEYIIFPYKVYDSKVIRYSEGAFRVLFPYATKHLELYRSQLDARAVDKNTQWFEYGRRQGLLGINQERLLISTVVTGRVKVFRLPKGVVPYGGIVISAINPDANLKMAMKLLESEAFVQYAYSVGTSISGNSVRITSTDLNNYLY